MGFIDGFGCLDRDLKPFARRWAQVSRTRSGWRMDICSPSRPLLLLGGAVGDRYGLRTVFVGGIVLFVLASLVSAAARSAGFLHRCACRAGDRRGVHGPGAVLRSSPAPIPRASAVRDRALGPLPLIADHAVLDRYSAAPRRAGCGGKPAGASSSRSTCPLRRASRLALLLPPLPATRKRRRQGPRHRRGGSRDAGPAADLLGLDRGPSSPLFLPALLGWNRCADGVPRVGGPHHGAADVAPRPLPRPELLRRASRHRPHLFQPCSDHVLPAHPPDRWLARTPAETA